jgi:flagellar hook protein FlgE
MYAGVAGLKTHQTKMDVIGNNIANVNTTSYKSQSISFSDLMYQTTQNASGATATTGGVNARQIGLGAKSGAISTAISTQGATQTTNNPFDLMITGKSFFVVNNGTSDEYTRDGSFYVDGSGNLAMQSTGYYVYGWTAQTDATTGVTSINQNSGLGKLQVMSKEFMTYAPEGTTAAVISGNIDAKDANVTSSAGKTVTLEFYDNLGYLYTAEFTLKNTAKDNQYTLALTDVLDSTGKTVGTDQLGNIKLGDSYSMASGTSVSTYDPAGNVVFTGTGAATVTSTGTVDTTNLANLQKIYGQSDLSAYTDDKYNISKDGSITFYNATTDKTVTLNYNPTTGKISSPTAKVSMDFVNDVGSGLKAFTDIDIDLSTTTNLNSSGTSTIQASKGDLKNNNTGRKLGTMTGITVATDGKINATYSNGQTRLLGQIAVAEFANASGLEKAGDNLYSSTLNSGDPTVQDVTSDAGSISTGVLEMSNVDLSNEFTNMITAQRGFQANSRIITVSDTLLEELTNLKR